MRKFADRRWNPLAGATRYDITNRDRLDDMFPYIAEKMVLHSVLSGPGLGAGDPDARPVTVGYLARRKTDNRWVATLVTGNGWRSDGDYIGDMFNSVMLSPGHDTAWKAWVATRKATRQ